MVNNPELINKLINNLNKLDDETIKEAIKGVESEDMEEDIKILENVLETKEYGLCEITDTFYQAIENLLARNKELEKKYKIEKLKNVLDEESLKEAIEEMEKDYIPKSKIEKKISLYKLEIETLKTLYPKSYTKDDDYQMYIAKIDILQELMEE